MLPSLLIGALSGARSLTPLATVSDAARRDALPADNGAPPLLGHPLVTAGIATVAAGEIAGDKWKRAPDRIVASGMAARILTGAAAGAALAPRDKRVTAGLVAAAAAVGASYLTFAARMRAMQRYGQTRTGFVEDALVAGGSWW